MVKINHEFLGSAYSEEFKDFVNLWLVKDPDERPGVIELLQHKFVNHNRKTSLLCTLIEELQLEGNQSVRSYIEETKEKQMHKINNKKPEYKVSRTKEPKNFENYLDTVLPGSSELYGQTSFIGSPYKAPSGNKKNKIISETTMAQSSNMERDEYLYNSYYEEDEPIKIPTPHFSPSQRSPVNQQVQKNIKISNIDEEVVRASHRRFSKMPRYPCSNSSSTDYTGTIIVEHLGKLISLIMYSWSTLVEYSN